MDGAVSAHTGSATTLVDAGFSAEDGGVVLDTASTPGAGAEKLAMPGFSAEETGSISAGGRLSGQNGVEDGSPTGGDGAEGATFLACMDICGVYVILHAWVL